ncbi:MAG: DinB family protein [Chloroflexi bacterium]|nr:DinB family protein [Chloroflexota bacterium]MBU1752149.1 DinB family protein [Chloroflexota bacterium]
MALPLAAQELDQAVAAFYRFIRGLPATDVAEKAWGPKEVLAHLVFYSESYVAQVDATLAGRPAAPPRGWWDDLNAQAVEVSRGVPVAELLRRLETCAGQLCAVAQAHDPARIAVQVTHGATRRTLARLMGEEAGHIRHHLQALERQARRGYLDDVDRLRETVDGFCRFIWGLPQEMLVDASPAWGPKDVLAHLAFWHERYVAQVEAVLAGAPFAWPAGRRDDLTARAVEASRDVSIDKLLRRLQTTDERRRGLARTLDPQNVLGEC